MLTKIGLDTTEAAKGLKELTTAVNTSNSAWKAQEAQLKNAGDYVGAAKAKYEGLEATVKAQQEKLAQLKRYQSECNQTTKEGAESYNKYQNDINKATTRLASFTAQQDRAREAVNLQNTGILKLNQELKNAQTVTTSYVKMLQEQGQKSKAAAEESKGLQSQLSKMNTLYSKQVAELDRVKSASGENSTQYAQQAKRVNDLGTDIAKTTNRIKELHEQASKRTSAFMPGVTEKLDKINGRLKTTSHLFGTVFGANLMATGVTSALASIQAHFSELTTAVGEYDDKQQTMQATWKTLTGSAKKGQAMVDMGNKLSVAFGQNIDIVDELNQQFYHVLDNQPKTKQLTSSVLTMADAVGLSSENTKNLGLNFTHMMSSSKMQLGDFNHITDALPMYGHKLLEYEQKVQKNSKLTMSDLRDQMSAGKISAQDAENVMNELGKKYKEASENLMKTGPGMIRQIKAQGPALLDAIVGPLRQMRNPFIGQISKWVGESSTKDEFGKIGDNLVKQINKITKAFGGGGKVDLTSWLDKSLKGLNQGITNLGNSIVKNKSSIEGFLKMGGELSKASWNVLIATLKALLPVIELVGKAAEKYPKTFTAVATSALLASKAIGGISLAIKGIGTVKTVASGIKGLFVMKDAVTGEKNVTKLGKVVATVGKSIGNSIKWTASVVVSGATKAMNGLKTAAIATGKAGAKALKFTANVVVKGAQLALTGLIKTAGLVGKAFLTMGKFMLTNPFGIMITAILAVTVGLAELYKHNKKFRNFMNGLGKAAENAVKTIVKFFKSLPKDLKKIFDDIGKSLNKFGKSISGLWKSVGKDWSKGWSELSKETNKGVKQTSKDWDGVKSSVSKATSSLWKSTKNDFKNGWSDIGKDTRNGVKEASKDWNNLKTQTGKFAADMMKNNQNTFSKGYKVMQDESKVWHDITSGNWGNLGSDTKKWASDMTKFWKSIFSSTYDWLNKLTGGRLGDMLSTFQSILSKISKAWNETWSSVKSFFSGIWDGIKSAASAGIRGVVNVINGGINGIDKVISFFGGKATAISPIKLAAGTMNGRLTKDTIAVLNDGHDSPETGNREMVEKKDGRRYLVHGTNTLSYLEAGDAVYNASQTRKMMANALPHFGLGTMFGNIAEAVEGTVGDVSKWFGDKIEAVEKFVKDPVAQVTSVFDKSIGSLSGASEFTKDFAKPSGHFLVKQGKDWFTKLFKSLEGSLDNPGGTGVERWRSVITAVAERMKVDLSSAGMNAVLHRIAQESNGSPTVTNNWDSNAKAGHPSTGLLQYIQPTFDHWLPKGFTNNIHNGSSQIAAMFNDSNWLRDISVKGGWGPTGHKQMAKGGIVSQNQMIEVAENNKPEMVIPIDASEKSRANQLLAETNKLVNPTSNDDVTTMATKLSDTETQLRILNEKFDTLLQMFNALLGGQNAQTKAIKASGTTPLQFYKKQSNDQSVSDYQAI